MMKRQILAVELVSERLGASPRRSYMLRVRYCVCPPPICTTVCRPIACGDVDLVDVERTVSE